MAGSTHHPDYQLLLKMLKTTRESCKVPQTELANRLDTTQTFISKVERGERRLDIVELVEMLEALAIKPEDWLKDYVAQRHREHKNKPVTKKLAM
ncbi:helix-turn-helix transcriptional regulator [Dyella sp. 7MK23]|uniref:Helix-turn-helix transcriptional regulator n=2 Tax=Dyella acidiphila TaxID=2775866 RepID=A0ABR9GFG8_9GAMM|nr:helix-turn-helix transcriptional regulator [Dyella acidiphila]